MAISKIIYKTSPNDTGTVWMDATPATATAADITSPKTAMLADGVLTTGTGSGGGGGGGVEEKDVNFIDYNGDLLYSYTKADFANLSAMPANPDRTSMGLSAQGWNWSLADAKTYVASYDKLWIGQEYDTVSGWTEVDVVFDSPLELSPYLRITVNGTAEIDWGDGSAVETTTGTSLTVAKYFQHTYTQVNHKYTLKVRATTGSFSFYDNTNSNAHILSVTNTMTQYRSYSFCITAIRLSATSKITWKGYLANLFNLEYVTIPYGVIADASTANMLQYCYKLKAVVIPHGVNFTTSYNYQFGYCYNLKTVSFPNGIDAITSGMFQNCENLLNVCIPSSVTTLGSSAFSNCYSLKEIIVPASVTTINGSVFYTCHSLKKIKFYNQVVTLLSGSVFANDYVLEEIEGLNLGNVTTIPMQTYYNCQMLKEIYIPSKLIDIPTNFASSCYSLKTLEIPSDVATIPNQAFQSCYAIEEIRFDPTTPPALGGSSVFGTMPPICKIYVPFSALYDYCYTTLTNYPSTTTYTYIGFATYGNGVALPTQDGQGYFDVTWYASKADAIDEVDPITVGNGDEIYCRYTSPV